MIAPAGLPEGRTHPYGFGLALDQVRERPAIEHGGSIFGYHTESIYIPSEDVFVAVFTNTDSPRTSQPLLARRLAALAIGEPYRTFARAEVDPRSLEGVFGLYRVGESGVSRRFFERDGKLYTMRDDGGAEREVIPAGNDEFYYPDNFTWFRIVRRPDGAHAMEMHQNGSARAELATRIGDIPPEPVGAQVARSILLSYVGRYQTSGPAAEIALAGNGALTVQLEGQPALALRAISDTEFEVPGEGARIVFTSENGQVTGLVIRQGGRELLGRRLGQ
jgi:hypothetical protein